MISCACATRGLRRIERVAWPSSYSRNAHDKNLLVRRAQSRIDQATFENEMRNWEDARGGRSSGDRLRRRCNAKKVVVERAQLGPHPGLQPSESLNKYWVLGRLAIH